MKQYIIYGKFSKLPKFIHEVIIDDKKWFYSLYNDNTGKYLLLRVSKRYRELDKILKERKIDFKVLDYSNISECNMTFKYFNEFVNLFHAESVLAYKIKEKEEKDILERIIHLLFNMLGKTYLEESTSLAYMSVVKAYTAGSVKL